ncbi:MAG: acyl-CoA thioesterase [Bacteroidetes bacterium]|nr:acyl-CoA thioesterase [Bacteroidota bacterium]
MYSAETKIRIAYGDTDRMGYCYYGNYSRFYEVARTELLRSLGKSYRELEEMGIMMPVISMSSRFIKPAYYDEEITVRAVITEPPRSRIRFEYEIYNDNNELINTGETTLAFIDRDRNRPQPAPEFLVKLFA